MKKATLLIVLMLIMTLTAFADFDVAVSGSANMTMGVDLNNTASGITNATSSGISFTLVSDNGFASKGGEETVHGFISVSGWGATVGNDGIAVAPGSVTAKIMLPAGAWVDITSAVSALNIVNPLEDDDGSDDDADTGIASIDLGKSGGFTIGVPAGPAVIELGIYSENDWVDGDAVDATWSWNDTDDDASTPPVWSINDDASDDAANLGNAYGMFLGLSGAVSVATFNIDSVIGYNYADTPIGLAADVSVAAGPATIYVKADVNKTGDADALLDLGAGLSAAVAGITLGFDMTMTDADYVDTLTKVGLSGLVEGLGLDISFALNNVNGEEVEIADNGAIETMNWKLTVATSYALATAKPYATITLDNAEVFGLTAGVELSVIENAAIKIEYASDNVPDNKGTLTVATTISYAGTL